MTAPVFVLASASPARKRLLESSGFRPVIAAGSFDEEAVPFDAPESYVETLARGKAQNVLSQAERLPAGKFYLLACDSVLIFEGLVHGKPADPGQAVRRWQAMRGKSGSLYTGHYLCLAEQHAGKLAVLQECVRVVRTDVSFADALDEEIRAYVQTGEPLRCAGAFALEGLGGLFVERLSGCHSNVIGLSLPALRSMLLELGASPVAFWSTE